MYGLAFIPAFIQRCVRRNAISAYCPGTCRAIFHQTQLIGFFLVQTMIKERLVLSNVEKPQHIYTIYIRSQEHVKAGKGPYEWVGPARESGIQQFPSYSMVADFLPRKCGVQRKGKVHHDIMNQWMELSRIVMAELACYWELSGTSPICSI